MEKNKIFFQILILLLFIVGIAFSQNYIEAHATKKQEMLYFVPQKKHLAYTNFGFKPVLADMLWLRGISYFMFHLGGDNDYKYLFGMLDASVALDPKFKQVYRDAMTLLLNDKEHYAEAETLILIGLNNLPQDWEMSYMAGMLYAYYLKQDEKSLRYFEKCWGEIPHTNEFKPQLENVQIMVRLITEKKNDKKGLILYWVNKYENQQNKESKEFCVGQIRKYASAYMEERLNEIYQSNINIEEKSALLNNAVDQFKFFFITNKLASYIEAPLDELFGKVDAYGYPWVFSEKTLKLYSFGNAHEFLSRKINLFNIKLWGRLDKYITLSVNDLINFYPSERSQQIKLKPEFSEFPPFENLYNEKDNWLYLEFPLFPIYDRKHGVFLVPEYQNLKDIDKKYK